ncbi:MAG: hypothetical protein B7Z73_02420 [Planctomycetia bacterium 21-64-5]|nr:MAG: hypothetical protein B7Z73_02420 [Planctomycetia bacterium 21-64-5]HQU42801.1 hypothetical protein [Pirellulales bacterium]
MAKKKAAAKKKSISKPLPRQAKPKSEPAPTERTLATKPSGPRPPSAEMHVYRHEVESNPAHASLIVEIPIAAGRGEHPCRPSFVGFTAEMNEEHWPDQFAFRILSLEDTTVRVMISRIDQGPQERSWGAKLVVHVLVIADAAR